MADVKWIKIATDIFDDEKIMLIEASGDDCYAIITVWFKLLCLAGKQNNGGIFMLNDKLAYNEEMLATIFRMKSTTIRKALDMFEQFGMIERIEGVVSIPNWNKHQSLDKLEQLKQRNREYVRKYRSKQKQLKDYSKLTCKEDVSKCKALDIDKEIEEENKNKNPSSSKKECEGTYPTFEEVKSFFEEEEIQINPNKFYSHYQSNGWKVGKDKINDWKSIARIWNENYLKAKTTNKDITLEDWQIEGMKGIMEDFKNDN